MSDGKDDAALERIESVHVKGFRSLADVRLDGIPNPMVLLGPNGTGKSNVLRFFEMLKEMAHLRLGEFTLRQGGADDQLFGGARLTQRIEATVFFQTTLGRSRFSFVLKHAHPDRITIAGEQFRSPDPDDGSESDPVFALFDQPIGHESAFVQGSRASTADMRHKKAVELLGDCAHYQFHDTSDCAPVKTRWDVEDNHRLLGHGGNLASVLLSLQANETRRFDLICKQIALAVPDFNGFQNVEHYGKTILRWRSKATGKAIGAHLTSDGSLRCFQLVTLLNLPDEMLPRVVLLDEPELGLHPAAIALISHMVKSLARRRQVIIATQSPHFVDAFGLGEMVVLNLREGRTEVDKPDSTRFGHLLKEYSTGELWWKGVLGG